MTPRQKIIREILLCAKQHENLDFGPLDTPEQVENAWIKFDTDEYNEDFRHGYVETNISPDRSRHYASKAVAIKCCDGTWVGWTYFYAGGKHGEPEAVPWMEDAYELTCVEEEKLVVIRTFTIK